LEAAPVGDIVAGALQALIATIVSNPKPRKRVDRDPVNP
jgi:hypothetical protein